MKKTILACIAVAAMAVLAAVTVCMMPDPQATSAAVSPFTGDLNLFIIIPIMLIAAFMIFIIIKNRRS